MGEVSPPMQQGFSASLLSRTHRVPTHNKKLQNVEHGLAVRDKMRIINYIQAKPRRRSSSSSPLSPVSPEFHSLAEELMSAAAAVAAATNAETTNQLKTVPPTDAETKVMNSLQDGKEAKKQSQGFSARKLPSGFRGGNLQNGSVSSLPDSTNMVGFSARRLQDNGSGVSKALGFSSRAHVRSTSSLLRSTSSSATSTEDDLTSLPPDCTSKLIPQSPSVTGASNEGDKPSTSSPKDASSPEGGFSARKLSPSFSSTSLSMPLTATINSVSPVNKIDFALKSPPQQAGFSARSHKAIASKAAARKNVHNAKRPGLSSTLSDSNQSLETKQEQSNDIKQEDVAVRTSPVVGFSARNPPPGLSLPQTQNQSLRKKTRHHSASESLLASGSVTMKKTPVIGFSARKLPPGLTSSAPELRGQVVRHRTRHHSTPESPLPNHTISSSSGTNQQGVSNSCNQLSDLESNQQSYTKEANQASIRSVTPPPGFSARNPPPGFSARNPPPGFGTRVTPPPGFGPRSGASPPPGFGPKISSSPVSKGDASQKKKTFQVNFKTTSAVHLPRNSTLSFQTFSDSSIATAEKLQKLPNTSPEAPVGSSTIGRLARQQLHPYTPKEASSTEIDKQAITHVAKAELDVIKKAHVAVENSIPVHVQKLEAVLNRIKSIPVNSSPGDNCKSNASDEHESSLDPKIIRMTWRGVSMSHSMLLNSSQQHFSFAVANICHILESHGKEMDQFNKNGMDRVFATIRNIILDHSKKILYRIQLLDVLELRANNWVKRPVKSGCGGNSKQTIGADADDSNKVETTQGSASPLRPVDPNSPADKKSHQRLDSGFSDDETDVSLQRKFHDIRLETPLEDTDQATSCDAQDSTSTLPTEGTKADAGCQSGVSEENGSNNLRKGEPCRKYSREFILSCYDSPMSKEMPAMLHFTFLHSDSGFIVDRNDEDPRDLIKATHLPPLLKPLSETHGMRGRRIYSWPGPSLSSIPEKTDKTFGSRPTFGLLGAAPGATTKPSAPQTPPGLQDEAPCTTAPSSSSLSVEQPGDTQSASLSKGRTSPSLIGKGPGPVLSTVSRPLAHSTPSSAVSPPHFLVPSCPLTFIPRPVIPINIINLPSYRYRRSNASLPFFITNCPIPPMPLLSPVLPQPQGPTINIGEPAASTLEANEK